MVVDYHPTPRLHISAHLHYALKLDNYQITRNRTY